MKETIREVIREKSKHETFDDGSRLLEELGMDSLDVMEAIMESEGKTGMKIKNELIHDIYTVKDIYKLFEDADKRRQVHLKVR